MSRSPSGSPSGSPRSPSRSSPRSPSRGSSREDSPRSSRYRGESPENLSINNMEFPIGKIERNFRPISEETKLAIAEDNPSNLSHLDRKIFIFLLENYPNSVKCCSKLLEFLLFYPITEITQIILEHDNSIVPRAIVILFSIVSKRHSGSADKIGIIKTLAEDTVGRDSIFNFLLKYGIINSSDLIIASDTIYNSYNSKIVEYLLSKIKSIELSEVIDVLHIEIVENIWDRIDWKDQSSFNDLIYLLLRNWNFYTPTLILFAIQHFKRVTGSDVYMERWFIKLISAMSKTKTTIAQKKIFEDSLIDIFNELIINNIIKKLFIYRTEYKYSILYFFDRFIRIIPK